MAALELRQVSKVFGSGRSAVQALIDIDLVAERGELVAVMGPSGSGKSTLLTIARHIGRADPGRGARGRHIGLGLEHQRARQLAGAGPSATCSRTTTCSRG